MQPLTKQLLISDAQKKGNRETSPMEKLFIDIAIHLTYNCKSTGPCCHGVQPKVLIPS